MSRLPVVILVLLGISVHAFQLRRADAGQSPRLKQFGATSRSGANDAIALRLDGTKRYYVEGGTLAAARWTFRGIVAEDFPEALPCSLDCRIARRPYGALGEKTRSFVGEIVVRSPSTEMRSESIAFALPATARPSAKIRIPLKLKGVAPNGALHQIDLFEDLVHQGELDLEVRCLEIGVFIAFTPGDLRLGNNKPNRDATRAAQERVATATDQAADPYLRAMAACRRAWEAYESGIHEIGLPEYPIEKPKIVLLSHELTTKRDLESILAPCRDELEESWKAARDTDMLRCAVTLNLLLQEDRRAWRLLEEANTDDTSLQSFIEYHRGKQRLDRMELESAWQRLNEAVRLDPSNDCAVELLGRLAAMLDEELPAKTAANVKRITERREGGLRRTLPWLTVVPIESAIRKLTRTVTKRGPDVSF